MYKFNNYYLEKFLRDMTQLHLKNIGRKRRWKITVN